MSDEAARLSALAAGLCQDAGITIEVGPGGWGWDPVRRVIRVSQAALRARGADYCAGVLTIEAGHYFLARHRLFPLGDFPSEAAGRALLHALEDARVAGWMADRYPGTRPWLAEFARHVTVHDAPVPSFVLFCIECASELTRYPGPMPVMPGDTLRALAHTREAREAYNQQQPPTDYDTSLPSLFVRYRNEVRPALAEPRWVPPRWEQLVQLRALEALQIAQDDILPHAAELIRNDLRKIEDFLGAHPQRRAQARRMLREGKVNELMEEALGSGGPKRPASPWVQELARDVFDQYLSARQPAPLLAGLAARGAAPAPPAPPHAPDGSDRLRPRLRPRRRPGRGPHPAPR